MASGRSVAARFRLRSRGNGYRLGAEQLIAEPTKPALPQPRQLLVVPKVTLHRSLQHAQVRKRYFNSPTHLAINRSGHQMMRLSLRNNIENNASSPRTAINPASMLARERGML